MVKIHAKARRAFRHNLAIIPQTAFVDGYLRRGSEVEMKSFSGAVASDGGYAVPKEIDAVIDSTLKSISPIRAIANVVQVGSAGYRKLVTQNGVASGWAAETATRPETATPTFTEMVPSFGDLYANPAATQAMLDDGQFDVEGWLASEIATEFAKAKGSASSAAMALHDGSHVIGDPFVLIEQDAARIVDETKPPIGSAVTVEALGLGDDDPAVATLVTEGNAIKPLAPVHGVPRWGTCCPMGQTGAHGCRVAGYGRSAAW